MDNIFKIKKEERLFALVAFLLIVAFNVLMVTYHYADFSKNGNVGYWTIFTKNFQVSGFDPYTYLTLSQMESVLYGIQASDASLLSLSFDDAQ